MKNSIFNSKMISLFVLLLFTFALLVSASYAWLTNFINVHLENDFHGSSVASYFAEGEGTQTKPYVINAPRHLYNLAWLQNQEPPVFTNNTYFKVCDNLENQNPIKLNMAGAIGGSMTATTGGAIPPIGTNTTPFKGHFDGCGSTISNLWVSTQKDDWKEQPHGDNEYTSTHVGLFGAISDGAIVENFVLDRIEVKSDIDAKVGIICGYVNAMIRNVGVYNGIITIDSTATCASNYSLLGEKDPSIYWEDMPTVDGNYNVDGTNKSGGDLIVDPNAYDYESEPNYDTEYAFQTLSAGEEAEVLDSIPYTAYYVGALKMAKSGNGKKLWDLREYNASTKKGHKDFVATTPTMEKIDQLFESYSGGDDFLEIGTPFNAFSNGTATPLQTHTVINKNGDEILVPQGCIWFKPENKGVVSLVFGPTNKGADGHAMVYACKRVPNENPELPDTLVAVEARTVEYTIPSGSLNDFKNGNFGYFDYEITDDDINNQYEFVIGSSNVTGHSGGSFGFLFLVLAGVNQTGGQGDVVERPDAPGEYAPIMYDVDYVVSPTTDIASDEYQNHQVLLKFEKGTAGMIYYLAAGQEGESKVYYTSSSSGISFTDFAASNPKKSQYAEKGQDLTPNKEQFLERAKTKEDSSP